MAKKRPMMDGGNEPKAALAKLLRDLSHRHSLWKVWQDFLTLCATTISNAVDPVQRETREAQYMATIRGYNKEELDEFARGFALVAEGLELGHSDLLGSLFMQLELGNAWAGRFFTPYCVAHMMGKMTMHDAREHIARRGFVTISDPCVGGGAMLIGAAHALLDDGINYQHHMHSTAQDIDITAVHMAYVQLTLLHVPAVVIHGNSLKNETLSAWYTPAHVLGGWGTRLRDAERLDAVRSVMDGAESPPRHELVPAPVLAPMASVTDAANADESEAAIEAPRQAVGDQFTLF